MVPRILFIVLLFFNSSPVFSQAVVTEPLCEMFYTYTSGMVQPFAKKHKLKNDGSSYYMNKSESVTIVTDENNMVKLIELDCNKGYSDELPFKLYRNMNEDAVVLRLGYMGTWDERNQYLSYFYDLGTEVRVWLNNPALGITNALYKVTILLNNKYNDNTRFIKYGGAIHPAVLERRKATAQKAAADSFASPVYIAFNYEGYPIEYRYYKKNVRIEMTIKNGINNGVMFAENKLHLRGVFKQIDRQYYPDKRYYALLYDHLDTNITLTARFDGYYNIDTCIARLKYKGRYYHFRIYSPIGLSSRVGIDTLDNQYLLNYFKWKTELPGADTTKLFIADGFQYYVWYTEVHKKTKPVSNPEIAKIQKEYNDLKLKLDAAANAILKVHDNQYYLLETKDASMDGLASTCSVTFTRNLTSRDKYLIYYLVPEKYLLNMRLNGAWTYQVGGGERKSIETGVAGGMSLGSGVTAFKQELTPQNAVPDACCYQLESSMIRLANDATFPVKMIIKKNKL